jgi:hypothetical protein
MQAIRTRYHGPTNTRGSRISAQCEAGRLSVPYAHELSLDENHKATARALRDKLGWNTYKGYSPAFGGSFDGDTYFVFAREEEKL